MTKTSLSLLARQPYSKNFGSCPGKGKKMIEQDGRPFNLVILGEIA